MKEKLKKIFLDFQVLAIILVVIDQITKLLVRKFIGVNEEVVIINNFFYFTLAYNTGAAFSGFSNFTWILAIISLIACVALEVYFFKYKPKNNFLKATLLVLLAGAFGNLIDRLFFQKVTDFIGFIFFGYHFAIFNVADICVTLSCVGLIIYFFVTSNDDKKKKQKVEEKNEEIEPTNEEKQDESRN